MGLAEIGTAGVVLWRGEVSRSSHDRQVEAFESLIARYPGRAALVCVIEEDAPTPTEEMRKATLDMLADFGHRVAGISCAIEAKGFRGAFVRSVLSGMTLLLPRSNADLKYFADTRNAAEWIVPRCQGVTVEGLCQLIETLRASLTGD